MQISVHLAIYFRSGCNGVFSESSIRACEADLSSRMLPLLGVFVLICSLNGLTNAVSDLVDLNCVSEIISIEYFVGDITRIRANARHGP